MESPQITSPLQETFNSPLMRSRSSTKLDDITSLTSFNPFSEEDEHDQSSYTLVTSLFSRMKNTWAAPLSSAVAVASGNAPNANTNGNTNVNESRRPSFSVQNSTSSYSSRNSGHDRLNPLTTMPGQPAPPLVSLTPVVSEAPTYNIEFESSPSRGGGIFYSPAYDSPDGGQFGNAIPGFPIQDDARSIRTTTSLQRSASVSKVIRRIRGEGLSRDYWMDDRNCKECYDCKSVFTTWRRKHHCRICGQIFCSRCASNIIKGARYGHDGMIRVCNLCLEKLAKVSDDDDDDRRSVISSVTSFPAHQLGFETLPLALAPHPQSPFAASQLFGRTDEPFNLYSIAETKRPISGSDDSGSRPVTPQLLEREDGVWEPIRENPAPFRRGLSEEDKEHVSMPNTFIAGDSPTAPGAKTPIDFPVTKPINIEGHMSTIQFPGSSPDHSDSPRPQSRVRSRFNSYGDFEVATPFIRSRVQSRIDDVPSGEPGWRTRRESTAYAQELNLTSMLHLRIMLRQMLTIEKIPNVKEWEEVLLKLALRIARELTFSALPHRQGEDMDVRRYVKIKKIPGGRPHDSEYVDGAVITKNVAHKQMSRFQRNPRVMLVTFPLEFYRVEGQYMHFGQIVRQEKEYLGNLASRIAALRPHVVLVEKSVSRLALESLAKHNIAVARTVKPSAIQFVARMTQADVFSSMDKLALEPRLGHCARYQIQTFDHPLIPGRRKTYMRFEGCSRDMGCTIILRGGDIETLRSIKKVTRFLTFIVRNLKLETHLWKDSVITLPSFNADAIPNSPNGRPILTNLSMSSLSHLHSSLSTPPAMTPRREFPLPIMHAANVEEVVDDDFPDVDDEQKRLSRRIQQSLDPYIKTFISVSATLRFPAPQPIRRMKELDSELVEATRVWEDEVVRREERSHLKHIQEATTATVTPLSVTPLAIDVGENIEHQDDINAQIEALPSLNLPLTPNPLDTPLASETGSGYFLKSPTPSNLVSDLVGATSSTMIQKHSGSGELPMPLKTTADIALESKLSLVKWKHEEQRRIWEWYLRKNQDDFVVEKYQCISLWEYIIPITDFGLRRACFAPQLRYITFYGENDCTLGQYIEKAVCDTLVQFLDPKAICAGKGCNQPLARHCKVYVHHETRIFVAVEQWDGQIIGRTSNYPAPDLITTWSACRICGSATPFIPVSEEMERYSFAKFLELHFYPADVQIVQGAGCQHNIYQHHIRYFASKGMTVRFQADPIVLHEIVYPPMRIRVRPETQLEIKNGDFQRLHNRNTVWYTALVDDLKLISMDAATGDEDADAKLITDINVLITRAEAEREEITRLINQIYRDSSPTDTLALNQARSYRQDKIVAWQQDFDKLPKPRPAQTMDRNSRRASSAFGSVRAMWPRRYDLAGAFDNPHLPSSSISEAEESHSGSRRVTGDSFTSSASEASESETNNECQEREIEGSTDSMEKDIEANTESSEKETMVQRSSPEELESVPESVPESAEADTSPAPLEASEPIVRDFAHEISSPKSDPDSDSTIGAPRDEQATVDPALSSTDEAKPQESEGNRTQQRTSKLPRRSVHQPSVAELVKKYQDFLPPNGVHELAKTAFPPNTVISESEQEYPGPSQTRLNGRNKSRHRQPLKMPSTSDFEQGYAANIAPRYLTRSQRSLAQGHRSRIPGPVSGSFESRESSRRPSPEKRHTSGRMRAEVRFSRTVSPPPTGRTPSVASTSRSGKPRSNTRASTKDKGQPRPPASAGTKSTLRRPPGGPGSKVSNIAKHFERMNRETERANRRYAVIRGKRARPVTSARAKVEVLDSVKDAIQDESESSDSSEADDEGEGHDEARTVAEHLASESRSETDVPVPEITVNTAPPLGTFSDIPSDGLSTSPSALEPSIQIPAPISLPPSPFLTAMKENDNPPVTPPPSDIDIGMGASERNSILKAISGLWLQQMPQTRHRVEFDAEDPMSDPEHIFRDSSMVVRTDEPTSIIALALNSPQYRDMLAKSRADKRIAREPKLTDGGEAFMPDDRSVAESTSTWGVVNIEAADFADPTEELKVPSSRFPWAISFESGGLHISCTVLYPEHFDALRRTYDCEKSMIESLARCVKWDANGGKSGSAFLKTRDDRFIAKELSKPELQTMETFAPAYFDYMSSAVTANRPTLLAKVFGCYKLTFKKAGKEKGSSKSKSAAQMNLLVMENLFYDRRFSKIYDLKGSTRGRHVQSTGRENEVLLDENLVQTAHLSPFYLREHSKRILRGALYNDSKFLADINVMDYSLVVGVDSKENELVVGIVDYIRTYTWDKKLESWVKESAFMGGAGKGEPTIVTPRQYRQRFLGAMERYFPLVPDRWMKQKDTPEEDTHGLSELWPDW